MIDTARLVADATSLNEVLAVLVDEPRYALDTEFHRERTYHPKVALVQFAWPGGIALVDPLAVDIRPLATLFRGPGVAVIHAAQQDFDVLTRACGAVPSRLFDTQLAAGFLGHATPSLGNLLSAELGVKLPKADRLSDWLRRPLTAGQEAYAAADVAHLLELHDRLVAQLESLGRLEWAEAECEELRVRPTGPGDPYDAWLKLKDVRTLRGRSRGVARAVAAWRERRASELDLPVRFVLPDLAVLGIAQRPPTTTEELRQTRGVEERHARGSTANELLAAVREGLTHPVDLPETNGEELDRQLRPAVTLVSAWVSQLARDQRIDTALLATRADLVDLLRGDPDARLSHGWRAATVGEDIRHLVEGEAALAFDGRGGLRLLKLA
ncbi:MAG TPA: HRDC domain-containing protein [Acidimicrobiales bacterium]